MDSTDLPTIDAHLHFWDLSLGKHPWLCGTEPIPFRYGDYSAIRENFLVDDFLAVSRNQNISKAVYVEAEWDPKDPLGETAWVHALHEAAGWPNAFVGQAWFDRGDISTVLADQAAYPLTRGIRQKPRSRPSPERSRDGPPGSMVDPNFRKGYELLASHKLHYELQTPWWHLGEAAGLARDFPETLIVLNHTGLPADRGEEAIKGWTEAMETFASQPNTAVKISGICVPGQKWTTNLNQHVVTETIRIFGEDRCMFASNFPVDGLLATYDEIFDGFKAITGRLSRESRRKLFHDNAQRIYRPV